MTTLTYHRVDPVLRDELDMVIRMNGPVYRRIRQNCCDESGLPAREVDRHAAAIVLTLKTAYERRH